MALEAMPGAVLATMIDRIIHNQCESQMSTMPDDCIDMVVTDPPYGANFMGKDWDKAMPSVDTWSRLLRVMKPGAFAFVMSLPRQDLLARMIINLEDAGFDVSFSPILWAFATGFPKAQNMGKMVDKRLGAERKVVGKRKGTYADIRRDEETGQDSLHGGEAARKRERIEQLITAPSTPEAKELEGSYTGYQAKPVYEVILVCQKPFGSKHKRSDVYRMLGGKYDYWYTQRTVVTKKNLVKLTEKWNEALIKSEYDLKEGDVIERRLALNPIYMDEVFVNREISLWWKSYHNTDITSSVTHALATGKGITWLDAGRIPYESDDDKEEQSAKNPHTVHAHNDVLGDFSMCTGEWVQPTGRFAPNLLCSDDVLNDGNLTKSSGGVNVGGLGENIYGHFALEKIPAGSGGYGDSGSFSRYFSLDAWAEKNLPESVNRTYPFLIVPKPSPSEKNAGLSELDEKQMYKCDNSGESLEIFGTTDGGRKPRENYHNTVKSIKLGAYLIAIGSRVGDIVFDPFCGSGSFCISAAISRRHYIGTEIDADMCNISERRIEWHVQQARLEQPELFDIYNESR